MCKRFCYKDGNSDGSVGLIETIEMQTNGRQRAISIEFNVEVLYGLPKVFKMAFLVGCIATKLRSNMLHTTGLSYAFIFTVYKKMKKIIKSTQLGQFRENFRNQIFGMVNRVIPKKVIGKQVSN